MSKKAKRNLNYAEEENYSAASAYEAYLDSHPDATAEEAREYAEEADDPYAEPSDIGETDNEETNDYNLWNPQTSSAIASAEEQRKRFVGYLTTIKNGTPSEQQKTKDQILADLQKLVFSAYHHHYKGYRWLQEDLIQAGCTAIFETLKLYDPEKSAPSTFFYPRILCSMGQEVAHHLNSTRASNQKHTRLSRARAEFLKMGIPSPTTEQLAALTGMTVAAVKSTLDAERSGFPLSLDNAVNAASDETPEMAAMRSEEAARLERAMRDLSPESRLVIEYKMGFRTMPDGKLPTEANIAAVIGHGLTASKVASLFQAAIGQLKVHPVIRDLRSSIYIEKQSPKIAVIKIGGKDAASQLADFFSDDAD